MSRDITHRFCDALLLPVQWSRRYCIEEGGEYGEGQRGGNPAPRCGRLLRPEASESVSLASGLSRQDKFASIRDVHW